MSATPGRAAGRRPFDLFETGLLHLDEAARIAEQASPNFTKATMRASLATACFAAADVSRQFANDYHKAIERQRQQEQPDPDSQAQD